MTDLDNRFYLLVMLFFQSIYHYTGWKIRGADFLAVMEMLVGLVAIWTASVTFFQILKRWYYDD